MRKKKGFTLVEALISIMLLTIAWVATVEVAIIGVTMGSIARHKIQAIYVIQRAVEDLHRKPFSQITNSTATVSIDTRGTPDNTADDLMGTQTVTVTNTSTYYKKVVVGVSWNERLRSITKAMAEYGGTYICSDPVAN